MRSVGFICVFTVPLISCSLKKVQGKKKRDAEAAEVLRKAKDAEEVADVAPDHAGGGGDLLGSKDEDVIF